MTGFPGSSSFPGSSPSPFPGSSPSPFPAGPGQSPFPRTTPAGQPGNLFGPPEDPFEQQRFPEPSAGPASSPRPPLPLLAVAVLAPALSLLLLLVGGWGADVAGWVVATFGTFGVLTAFTLKDTARRADAWYLPRDGVVSTLRLVAVGLALVAAAVHAYGFADWFSRLPVFAS